MLVKDLYEGMYLYGLWINHSMANNVSVSDGRAWVDFAKNKTFPGWLIF